MKLNKKLRLTCVDMAMQLKKFFINAELFQKS